MKKFLIILPLFLLSLSSCSNTEKIQLKDWIKNKEIKNISEDLKDQDSIKTQTWENINLLKLPKVEDEINKKSSNFSGSLKNKDVIWKKIEENISEGKKKLEPEKENSSEIAKKEVDKVSTQTIKEEIKKVEKVSTKTTKEEKVKISEKIESCKDESCKKEILVKESLEKNNTSVCDVLKWDEKDKCKSEALINLAIKNMDKKLCEKIPLKSEKETCNQILKAITWK